MDSANETLEEVLARERPFLIRMARRHGAGRDEAEDIVQEALAGLLSRPDSFRGESELRTWAATAVRHTVVDYLRRLRTRRRVDRTMTTHLKGKIVLEPASDEEPDLREWIITSEATRIRADEVADRETIAQNRRVSPGGAESGDKTEADPSIPPTPALPAARGSRRGEGKRHGMVHCLPDVPLLRSWPQEDWLVQQRARAALTPALDWMPRPLRNALIWDAVLGYTWAELGRELKQGANTVRSRVESCYPALRARLQAVAPEPEIVRRLPRARDAWA